MENGFWHERWQKGEIGFHQVEPNDLLVKHWPSLELPRNSEVFVPLCGKAIDMAWLASRGHRVIGAELSPIAVAAFFAERGLEPKTEEAAGFQVNKAGPYEVWCGDVFALPPAVVARVAAVYDRAALVAFPKAGQPRYATKLAELSKPGQPLLLVGLAFDGRALDGPPFPIGLADIVDLFGRAYTIALKETRDGLERSQNLKQRGLTMLEESAYLLRRK